MDFNDFLKINKLIYKILKLRPKLSLLEIKNQINDENLFNSLNLIFFNKFEIKKLKNYLNLGIDFINEIFKLNFKINFNIKILKFINNNNNFKLNKYF